MTKQRALAASGRSVQNRRSTFIQADLRPLKKGSTLVILRRKRPCFEERRHALLYLGPDDYVFCKRCRFPGFAWNLEEILNSGFYIVDYPQPPIHAAGRESFKIGNYEFKIPCGLVLAKGINRV